MSRRNHCFNWDMRLYGTTEGWWDASDISTRTIATGVSQLNDKSGNNRHFTQATGSRQPTVASADQNGRDTLVLSSANQTFMTAGTNSTWNFIHNGSNALVFVVIKPNEVATDTGAIHNILGTYNAVPLYGWMLSFSDSSTNFSQIFSLTYNTSSPALTNTFYSLPVAADRIKYQLICNSLNTDDATLANRNRIYLNSVLVSSNINNGTAYTGNSNIPLSMGGQSTGQYPNNRIGEIAIYSGTNSNYSISFVSNLLNHKWGLY